LEKYGTAGLATHDSIIRRMRFACWNSKATDTQNVTFILVHTYISRLVKP